MRADREVDFHHYTRAEMLSALENVWASRAWHGLRRVRVIHGTGAVLWRELRHWCDEKGIPWAPELHNPGATILHPSQRAMTSPAPPHRPLASQKQRLPAPPPPVRKPRVQRPAAPPTLPAEEAELMRREFERLSEIDQRVLRRKKHSSSE